MKHARVIMTIGTFDGVHLGHRALIERARTIAGAEGSVIVLAFDPHPTSVLRPGSEPARLTTFARRQTLLKDAGADEVIRLEPTPELLAQTPGAFLERVCRAHRVDAIVEGPDFHFGRARSGDITDLERIARNLGVGVEIVDPVTVALTDQTLVPARSTLIRWLLDHGRVADAHIALGRPYDLDGVVERGDRRGRQLGYPTANIRTDAMLPLQGVYAGVATLPDGRRFAAAICVGRALMFPKAPAMLEAHLLDVPVREVARGEDRFNVIQGLEEYDWRIRLQFVAWLREQFRFDSLDALTSALDRDCARTREALETISWDLPTEEQHV